MYFIETTMNRLQKISDSTPSTAAGSELPPAAAVASFSAYNGLVPMSP